MALDEALFRITGRTGVPFARFYHWSEPAHTFGYFDSASSLKKGAIRRFTGGGLVEHGDDLTFLLTFPRDFNLCDAPAQERYRRIHEAIENALRSTGYSIARDRSTPSKSQGPCFETPVPEDLLDPVTGRKIGGGAQRRTREGVIHQGSLRLPPRFYSIQAPWITEFLHLLFEKVTPVREETRSMAGRDAANLNRERYQSDAWNRFR